PAGPHVLRRRATPLPARVAVERSRKADRAPARHLGPTERAGLTLLPFGRRPTDLTCRSRRALRRRGRRPNLPGRRPAGARLFRARARARRAEPTGHSHSRVDFRAVPGAFRFAAEPE